MKKATSISSPVLRTLIFSLVFNFPTTTFSYSVQGLACHVVKLQQKDNTSPFCLAASSAMELMQHDPPLNFLASQVWPSARVAAQALQQHASHQWRICEFGCGPGLPSLTAAKALKTPKVIATDLDPFALELVERASQEQGLQDRVVTQTFDLMAEHTISTIPDADLYLFSDVFESSRVAQGAARVSRAILEKSNDARIWVFAQSDRACREEYKNQMRELLEEPLLDWSPLEEFNDSQRVFLCDLDETKVLY